MVVFYAFEGSISWPTIKTGLGNTTEMLFRAQNKTKTENEKLTEKINARKNYSYHHEILNAPLFFAITPPFYQFLIFTDCTAELIAPLKQLFFKHRCIKRLLKTPLKFQYTAVFLNTAVFFKTPLNP